MMQPDPLLDAFAGTDRFEIKRRLGAGGMGVVYEAYDRERGEAVALKTMREPTPDRLLRFKNEFRALAEMRHPNLVRLHELHAERGWWFFTMELIEGGDFLRHIALEATPLATQSSLQLPSGFSTVEDRAPRLSSRAAAPFDPNKLRQSFGQLAEGLAALHRAGHIHRDIKPANVLVTRDGRVVIVDFGLVKEAPRDAPRTVSSVSGTLAYMAPEQASGLPVTTACDWYAAGVVLFQALTGQLPFSDPMPGGPPREPPRPSRWAAGVPADLDELCVELLSHAPELRPRGREVLLRLGPSREEPRPTAEVPAFVGRARELAELQTAYRAVTQAPRVVLVEGEGGVGKTALAAQLQAWLRTCDPRPVVLSGRCAEQESLPFQAMDGIMDALSHFLGRLPAAEAAALLPRHFSLLAQVFPVLRRHGVTTSRQEVRDHAERRVRLFAAARELLARVADRWPLVLILDNLHWAEDDGLTLLAETLHPPDAPALLFVGLLRNGARVSPEQLLARLPQPIEQLTLGGLDATEAERLARTLARDRDVSAIVADAKGHPLFITELCRHARPSRELSLDEIFRRKIDALAADARVLLQLMALAGTPPTLAVLAFAAGLKPELAARHARQLVDEQLVVLHGVGIVGRIEPSHDRLRHTVLATMDAAQRKLLHERLALALDAAGRADPEELARHWLGAAQPARAASLFAAAAAEAAQTLAFARAARLYRESLDIDPDGPDGPDGEAAVARWTALGDALHHCGRGVAAADAWLGAAERSRDLDAVDLRRRAAEQLLRAGHIKEGMELLGRVLDELQLGWPRTPNATVAGLLWQRARLRLGGLPRAPNAPPASPLELARVDVCNAAAAGVAVVDPLLGAYFQTRALRAAAAAGEPERLCRALASEAVSAAAVSNRTRARALLERAETLARPLAEPLARALVRMGAGVSSFLLGDWQVSAAESDEAIRLYREECSGAGWELGNAVLFSILARVYLGELGRLQHELPIAIAEAQQRGDLHALIALGTGQPILVWLAADDVSGARHSIETLARHRPEQRWATQHAYFNPWAQASIDLYVGDAAAAERRVAEAWPALEKSFLLRLQLIRLAMLDLRARTALAAGAQTTSPTLLARAERDARTLEQSRVPWAAPLGTLTRAGVQHQRGDREGAAALLDRCIAAFEAQHMMLHAACARRARGSDAWMATQKIRDPERLARVIAPAFTV